MIDNRGLSNLQQNSVLYFHNALKHGLSVDRNLKGLLFLISKLQKLRAINQLVIAKYCKIHTKFYTEVSRLFKGL